jgi:hypothetical protein
VEPEYGLDLVHSAGLHHLLGPGADFLARLEQKDHRSLEEKT